MKAHCENAPMHYGKSHRNTHTPPGQPLKISSNSKSTSCVPLDADLACTTPSLHGIIASSPELQRSGGDRNSRNANHGLNRC